MVHRDPQSSCRINAWGIVTGLTFEKTRPGRECNLVNEQAIFAILECHPPSPYIIQSFIPRKRSLWNMPNQQRDELSQQLGATTTWLEKLGLAHWEIRSGNMLLSQSGYVKLADFAYTLKDEGGLDRGTYKETGCRTEQFAIGSVFCSLTRGNNPFDNEWWGPDHGPICM
ncbi:hypothetical protein BKA56DRAFT_643861 [Ilyonectria sp. MPI-CAGE-AT-0026]|nr:hypothetical protein BKA56DRAFT_643861 [Ilyonectria sp. MPI-CAGE-AT-0026]